MTHATDLPAGTFTFLYTDIEGSTRLWEQRREAMKGAISLHDRILQGAVEKNGGRIFRNTGDGVCAAFNNASAALAAALEAQLAFYAEPWEDSGPLRVRMVLHTGEAEARRGDFLGSSLNRVGRLLGLAHGGQTLLSQATYLLIRDTLPRDASLKDLGEVRLRDLASVERVFQLTHPGLPAAFPPLASLDRRPNNLPVMPTPLIGRETELADILQHVNTGASRLLTLTGPGGTGKTRLGLQAAAELLDRFENGVFFVDLAPVRDPDHALAAIARTVGMRESSGGHLLDELKSRLRPLEILLLLDNFEQVIAAGPFVVDLLGACPGLHVLVTSREALHVRGEHVVPVPPLALPGAGQRALSVEQTARYEAVSLFYERARAVRPGFELTEENIAAVVEICLRLDGLPLAIELAAARLRLFSPQALLERLRNRLDLLRGGARDLPARQQTLRNTIGWSYDLLETGEQRLFELLALFPGGAAFEAFEAVAGEIDLFDDMGMDIFDGLVSLVDKSLVRQVEQNGGDPRLLMLATLRDYAAERLEENPEFTSAARRAHASYYADFASLQWERVTRSNREAALAAMEADIDNLRTAWSFWVAERHIDQISKFTDGLWMLYDARGWHHATVELTADLLDLLSSTPLTPERARQEILLQTSLARALISIKGGFTQEVENAFTRALDLSQKEGDVPQLFPVLRELSSFYIYHGEFKRGAEMGERILSLAENLEDTRMRVEGHLVLGSSLIFMSNLRAGLNHLEQGISDYDPGHFRSRRFQLGSDQGVASLTTSSLVLWMLGFPDRARERAIEAISLARDLKHPFSIAYALFHSGLLHLWRREMEIVRERAQSVIDIAGEHQFQVWRVVAICLDGAALIGAHQPKEGLAQIQQGMDLYKVLKTPPVFWPELLFIQASAHGQAGNPAEGLVLLDEAIRIANRGPGDCARPEFCRLKGELLLAITPENAAAAEQHFKQALDAARNMKAGMLELRAAVSYGRFLMAQGSIETTHQIVGAAYHALTEGFELADLRDARDLLGELAQSKK